MRKDKIEEERLGQDSCTTNDDGCAVICHAKKEFVVRWPKTSIRPMVMNE